MLVTGFTRSSLRFRRQKRELTQRGYESVPCPLWELDRGGRRNEVIIDVQIGVDGRTLYLKTGPDPSRLLEALKRATEP